MTNQLYLSSFLISTSLSSSFLCVLKRTLWDSVQQVIAEHLSVEEVAGIKEGFDKMDTNNKGKINIDELRVGLQKLGHQIADTDLQILMEAVSCSTYFNLHKTF